MDFSDWDFDRREKGNIILRYTPKSYTREAEPDEVDRESPKGVIGRADPACNCRNCTEEKR
jgi:hypothetical protein